MIDPNDTLMLLRLAISALALGVLGPATGVTAVRDRASPGALSNGASSINRQSSQKNARIMIA
jgi:hypothetical protein